MLQLKNCKHFAPLIEATLKHFEAKRSEALAHLEIYFTNPVGIGEHSDILAETIKWSEALANADDGLRVIKENFLV